MKKIPYDNFFAVVFINSKLERILFDKVSEIYPFSEPDTEQHLTMMYHFAACGRKFEAELFSKSCVSLLNANSIIDFYMDQSCNGDDLSQGSCAVLTFIIREDGGHYMMDTGLVGFKNIAGAFNEIAGFVGNREMRNFICDLDESRLNALFNS